MGAPLEVKEGIIVDEEGRPIPGGTPRSMGRSFSFSFPAPALLGIAILVPVAIAAGLAVITIVGLIFISFLVLSWISRLFTGPRKS